MSPFNFVEERKKLLTELNLLDRRISNLEYRRDFIRFRLKRLGYDSFRH